MIDELYSVYLAQRNARESSEKDSRLWVTLTQELRETRSLIITELQKENKEDHDTIEGMTVAAMNRGKNG